MATRAEVVGTIAVEVEADTSTFATRLEAALRSAVADATRNRDLFRPVVEEAHKAAGQAGSDFGVQFDAGFNRNRTRMVSSGRRSGKLFGKAFSDSSVDEASTFVGRLSKLLTEGMSALPGVGVVGQIFGLFGKGGGGGGLTTLAGFAAVLPTLMGAGFELVAIAGTLTKILGLAAALPGIFGTSLALIVPMAVAFQGFGTALGAVMKGNPQQIAKALEHLAPAARAVVLEFRDALPLLRDIRKETQQRFFLPLIGDLRNLSNVLGPTLKSGLSSTAGMIGDLFHRGLAALSTPEAAKNIERIFVAAQAVLTIFAGPVGHLFSAFGSAIIASLGPSTKLAAVVAGLVDKFAGKLDEWIASGKFEQWINDALRIMGELKGLTREVLDLFINIFSATGGEGEDTLKDLTHIIHQMNEALQDPQTRRSINGLIDLFKMMMLGLLGVGTAVATIGLAIGTVVDWAERLYHWLQRLFGFEVEGQMKQKAEDIAAAKAKNKLGNAFQLPHRGWGGLFDQPTLSIVGDGPEALVPLHSPDRARQVLQDAGLDGLMNTSSATDVEVHVYVGDREITDIVRTEVKQHSKATVKALRRPARES